MTNRRIKLLNKLIGSATGEDEAKLYKLTIERICIDMCDYYQKFYQNEGPGAMVYVPNHEDQKKSMFYLTVDNLICAVDDECGQNTSSLLGSINTNNSNKCGYVGSGVLSKIVFFANKGFANIAGQSQDPNKKDLVAIETVTGDTNIFRSSWRQNY